MKKILSMLALALAMACQPQKEPVSQNFLALFNGKDMDGWTPKFAGHEAGLNYKNTFRVEDGILKVKYDEYDSFRNEFGHLFFKQSFSSYRLRIEYRFVDGAPPGAPDWAFMNSGVMVHSQNIESMGLDQEFPVSLEAQFLGGTAELPRSTGNLCTPGTHVTIADTLTTIHCIDAITKTYPAGEWVNVEIIAFSDSLLHHVVNGDTVMTYTHPVIGGEYLPINFPLAEGAPLKGGYIALQSESHPIEFRKVELLDLSKKNNGF